MEEYIEIAKELLVQFGLNVIAALLILFFGRLVAKTARTVLRKMMARAHVDEGLISFGSSTAYAMVMVFVVISALGRLGLNTSSFVAVLGAAGLAVGLAFQGSLSNFASGVLMVILKPFKVGNFIEAGGVMGIVEGIGIFHTDMRTGDNKKMIIPNSAIIGGNITNFSAKDTRRIDLVVGVSYQDDLDKVRGVLEQILADESRILPEPAPVIGVLELADSSINFAVRPWVNSSDFLAVTFSLNEQIKKRFDAEGISIPFPQRDVHLYTEDKS